MTLFDVISTGSGLDVGDKDWDWGTYFDFSPDCSDPFDKCMEYMAKQIEVIKLQPDWYTICDFTAYIKKNINAFKKFFNEENRKGYRPKDYPNADKVDVDDGFYEAYMQGFESLLAGNYAEEDYTKLLNYLERYKTEKK